jgi:hypothetical protein
MQFFLLLDSQADVVVQACSKDDLSSSKAEHEHEQKPKRLKGSYCRRRQEHLRNVLRENFVESPGKSTDQYVVMDCLRNNQCRNDITLFFTMLLISYGAGNKMVNMLNKIGLTVHWDTMMNFLDKQLVVNEKYVQSRTPLNMPLLLPMDNVNIYRGKQHHHRLFKAYQENMWNFTGQGILIPNIDGIEDLFLCEDTSLESQHDVIKFTSDDITLQHYPEMEKIWSEHKDNYLLKLLEDGINCASNAQKPFKDTV